MRGGAGGCGREREAIAEGASTLGSQRRHFGVFSSAMLNPLKMMVSTVMGGKRASAMSEDGEAAPSSSPMEPAGGGFGLG